MKTFTSDNKLEFFFLENKSLIPSSVECVNFIKARHVNIDD